MAADRTANDFGRRLREARERRGISLRNIAQATKISVSQLEALERNDISRLPGGIFSRAFVRSYASAVGLDPEDTIRDFIARFPHDSVTAGHPQSAQIEDTQAVESDRRMATTFMRIILISVPVAIGVVYFGMGRQLIPTEVARPVPVAASAVPEPVETATRPAEAAGISQPDAPIQAGQPLTVWIVASRSAWVSATADGIKEIERTLEAGDQRTVEVRRELVLIVGDAGAITMTLNGASAKPLGRDGQVITARMNLSNFQQYLVDN